MTLIDDPKETLVATESVMRVKKRSGKLEPVDVNKIVKAVARSAAGLPVLTQCESLLAPLLVCAMDQPVSNSTSCQSAPPPE